MDLQASQDVAVEAEKVQRFNLRPAVDAGAALAAATVVSPIMTVIDKAVIESASGHTSLLQSMQSTLSAMIFRPRTVIIQPTFATMMLLYAGTYLTANCVDTLSAEASQDLTNTPTASWTKFGTVSSVNMGLSIYKDSYFAQAFGNQAVRRPLTLGTYVPFVLRDGITILASFNVPPLLAPCLPEHWDAYASRLLVAQMIAPAGSQLFATPLHLLGLDMYNRHDSRPWRERLDLVRRKWLSSSLARMCRIIPAYGLGGVVNTSTRNAGLVYLGA